MPLLRKAGLLGAAVSFARSERGRRMIADARTRLDTPENRDKLKGAATRLRDRKPR